MLCGIAVAVLILAGPHLFAETARAARPLGAVALRSLMWMAIAVAAYWALVCAPDGPGARHAPASSEASSRGRG